MSIGRIPAYRPHFEARQDFQPIKLDELAHPIERDAPLPHPQVNSLTLNPQPLGDLIRAKLTLVLLRNFPDDRAEICCWLEPSTPREPAWRYGRQLKPRATVKVLRKGWEKR